uniref:Uncharacterized protein n=1 Tax=Glossina palpalis gambiensis TaxID=67801 RepID=A0A1B0C537_9MUSC
MLQEQSNEKINTLLLKDGKSEFTNTTLKDNHSLMSPEYIRMPADLMSDDLLSPEKANRVLNPLKALAKHEHMEKREFEGESHIRTVISGFRQFYDAGRQISDATSSYQYLNLKHFCAYKHFSNVSDHSSKNVKMAIFEAVYWLSWRSTSRLGPFDSLHCSQPIPSITMPLRGVIRPLECFKVSLHNVAQKYGICMLLAKTETLKHSSGRITPLRGMVILGMGWEQCNESNGPSLEVLRPPGKPINRLKNGHFHVFARMVRNI